MTLGEFAARLLLVALLAHAVPLRRALRIDPASASERSSTDGQARPHENTGFTENNYDFSACSGSAV
jgi:hypothetical protein